MISRPDPASTPSTLVEALRTHAVERPGKTLYRFLGASDEDEQSLSFAELDRDATAIAAGLRTRAGAGRAVALLLYPPGLEFIRAFLGCLYAGVVAVPVYLPNARQESWQRLRAIARDAGAGFVLIDEDDRDVVAAWLAQSPDLALTPLTTARLRRPQETSEAPTAPLPAIEPDALAFLQYTSGSTGDPKGVMVSHANLMHNQRLMQRKFEHDCDAVIVGWLPQYHDMGLIGNILQPLFLGATAILMAPVSFLQSPLRWLRAISRYRATTSGGPDFAYRLCAERIAEADKAGLDLSGWQVAFNGAEPISAATLARFEQAFAGCGFRRRAFFPCYGLAEGTLFAVGATRGEGPVSVRVEREALARDLARPVADTAGDDDASVELISSGGLPGAGTGADADALSIVDPVSGERCAPGAIGEIWLHSSSVAGGYLGRDELSRDCFQARPAGDTRPHLRTGDLGFVHAGQLYVTGRLKDLIIVRGRNYYPQDIEAAVQDAFPELRRGCGAAFGIERGGEEALALVQEIERTALRRADLSALWHNVSRLVSERFGIRLHTLALVKPTRVLKTSSGKIRRKACRVLLEQGALETLARFDADRTSAPAAGIGDDNDGAPLPDTPALRLLADSLRLPAADLRPRRALGAYGLDSLQAAELEHCLRSRLGVRLDMSRLLDGMTVAEFLAAADDGNDDSVSNDEDGHADTAAAPGAVGPQQHAIWQLQTLRPEGRAYNIALPLRLDERLDPAALAAALTRLLRRHPQLDRVYREVDGVPRAAPRADAAPPLTVVDAPWDAARLDAALREQAAAELALDRGVFHAYLLQTGDGSLLHLVAHHIAVDAWSMQVLVRDLARAYHDAVLNHPELAVPARGYDDFLAAQQRWLAGAEGIAAVAEARAGLGAGTGFVNLPADRARPSHFGFVGGEVVASLDETLSAALRAKAGEWNTTLFTGLFASWQVLMHRLSAQTEFAIGVPVSQRAGADYDDVVGCFVDLKPMPCAIDPEQPFRELVAATRASMLRTLRLRRVPTRLTQRDQAAAGGWPATVQPNVRFALQQAQVLTEAAPFLLNLGGARVELSGLHFTSHALESASTPADLTLTVLEHEGRLHARFGYNREIFDRARIERIAAMYRELLRGIVADDATPIRLLPLLDKAERARMLARSAPMLTDSGPELCAHQLIECQAAVRGEALAVTGEDGRLSYADLNRRANRLARWLRAHSALPEDRIGVCMRRTTDMAVAFLATLKAGVCAVLLEASLPLERYRLIVEDARMKLLLSDIDGLDDGGAAVLDPRDGAAWAEYDDTDLDLPLNAANAAYVIYTSGSTGRPKGVVGLHGGIVNRTRWMIAHFKPVPGDRVLHSTPMGFVRAEREILFPLAAGATLVILPQTGLNRADAVLDAMEHDAITHTASSPSLLRMIIDHDAARFTRLPSLRHWFIGADALRPDLVAAIQEARPSLRLTYFYGSTEVSSDVAYFDVPSDYATDAPTTPIGCALPNTGLYLLDPAMEPVADGILGEIHVAGVQLARGYLGRPDLTAERFVRDPFSAATDARLYRTGDLAYRRTDGDLVVVGRNDDQVNLYGHRIELGEIAHALRSLPEVADAIALPYRQSEHTLIVAYVACAAGTDTDRFRGHLGVRLPSYMMPALIVRLDALPVTALGKIDRTALRAIDLGQARAANHAAAETPLQARIAQTLAELLGLPVEVISVKRNFFELGANSALLSELVSRLNRLAPPRSVRIADVFHHPTVRDLAHALLDDAGSSDIAATAQRSLDRARARRQAMARHAPASRPA